MPDNAPAAQSEQSWESRLWSIGKQVAFFIAIQFAIKQFMGGSQQKVAPAPTDSTPVAEADWSRIPQNVYPLWENNQTVDISLYISPSVAMPPLTQMKKESLIVHEKNFSFTGDKRDIHKSFSVPRSVQDNGTLWAHLFIGQQGAELDPALPSYNSAKAYRMSWPLTEYLAQKKVRKTRNLLEAREDEQTEVEPESPGPKIASYYHPNLTLSFIPSTGAASFMNLHPAVKQFYVLEATGKRDASGKNGWYYPVVYPNTFFQLKKDMYELNKTTPSIMAAMDHGMKETARKVAHGETTTGGGDGSELEMIKTVLLDSNIYLLGTTVIVTILHTIFELLAFSSDVGHWRKKKDNVGVSVRTILSNVVMQTIIFLYLLDNNENTSWMILFGQGIGIAIEAWKVTKTVDVRVREPQPGTFFHGKLPYIVIFEDKHKLSETEAKTEEYDQIAFKYMGILAVPLLLAYAVYSLMYETHKSWYSFVITTLVGSVYAYGFLMMVPSLYINYRLQSVAHMPAKAMTYKFLNTFIDDLFAFTIKMPILHRLATFRDDIIFFVYLYQSWAYRVDYDRVNEFGQGGDDETVEDKKAAKPLTSPPDAKSEDASGKAIASGKDNTSAKKRKA
ncbi:hypothetical protein AMS68_007460 [Peltaster fructicola]|uniref:Cleft lip and palate transmembrane 1 n=1 Tax=Peltaster fructicola TaxID=286661 RepID=A0A6H0Y4M0_9PEZI|nr:hypothetical protein AMS68_007460 [Peltaster fructicola]